MALSWELGKLKDDFSRLLRAFFWEEYVRMLENKKAIKERKKSDFVKKSFAIK